MRRSIRIKRKNGTAGLVNVEGSIFMAGEIVHYAGATAPVGWLKCNGAAVSRSTYAVLFAAIGTLYGAGDGTTTFNLPDYRGEFLRGLDDGRGVDASRALGSFQADNFKSHTHAWSSTDLFGSNWASGQQVNNGLQAAPATNNGCQITGQNTYVGGAETRPRNIAALVLIKY